MDNPRLHFYNKGARPWTPLPSAAGANLACTMARVCNDHEALIITRNGDQPVVMRSLEEFSALQETAYLLRNHPTPKACFPLRPNWQWAMAPNARWPHEADFCGRSVRGLPALAKAGPKSG